GKLRMLRYLICALLLAAGAYAQAPCKCGATVASDSGDIVLYELPPVEIESCDAADICSLACYESFDAISGGGDLNFITSDGVTTVGQYLCNLAATVIDSQFAYANYDLCDSGWILTGDQTMQPLCCDDQGTYFECAK
ncbi:hypothetical protein SK128_011031, partial [Halocaridina rubra]